MIEEIRKVGIFIKRDFKILLTYRLAFSALFLNMIFNLFYFILFGSMFGNKMPTPLEPYQQDFVSYLIVGSVGWSFLWSVMSASSISVRSEMMMGTLESLLLSSVKLTTLIVAYTIFGCLLGFISVSIIILVGYFMFNAVIAINLYTLVILFLSTVMMTGFGMIFSGLTIWIKNIGDTIPLIQNITMFFSGVYFPITVLPSPLQKIAKFIPFYYSIEGMRISTVEPSESLRYIIILIALSIIFVLVGLYSMKEGVKKAKRDGSLSFY